MEQQHGWSVAKCSSNGLLVLTANTGKDSKEAEQVRDGRLEVKNVNCLLLSF